METPDRLNARDEGAGGFQRTLVLIGLGYGALVALAFYADYKIQQRRASKRREAKERGASEADAWFRKDDDERPP